MLLFLQNIGQSTEERTTRLKKVLADAAIPRFITVQISKQKEQHEKKNVERSRVTESLYFQTPGMKKSYLGDSLQFLSCRSNSRLTFFSFMSGISLYVHVGKQLS